MRNQLSIPESIAVILKRMRERREFLRLSQAVLAHQLGWPTSKISKLEGGQQPPTLEDLLHLQRVLGEELLGPIMAGVVQGGAAHRSEFASFWSSIQEVDPEMFHPNLLLQELVEPGSRGAPLFPLDGKYFPLSKAIRVIEGAQIPKELVGPKGIGEPALLAAARVWLDRELKRFNLAEKRLEGLRLCPALRAGDIDLLRRPRPLLRGPVAPEMKTRMRGEWMSTSQARMVVDPRLMAVTVVAEPMLVRYPLRVIVVAHPTYGDVEGGEDGMVENEQLVFRAAGLLASAWAQEWMRSSGRLWFSPSSGPFRDVPVPAKLWHLPDREGKQVEKLARDIWDSETKKTMIDKAKKSLDKIVVGLMAGLHPCR